MGRRRRERGGCASLGSLITVELLFTPHKACLYRQTSPLRRWQWRWRRPAVFASQQRRACYRASFGERRGVLMSDGHGVCERVCVCVCAPRQLCGQAHVISRVWCCRRRLVGISRACSLLSLLFSCRRRRYPAYSPPSIPKAFAHSVEPRLALCVQL